MKSIAWILGALVCGAIAAPAHAQSRSAGSYSSSGRAFRDQHAAAMQRFQTLRTYRALPPGAGVHGSGVSARDVHGRVVYNGPGGGRYTRQQVNRALGNSRRGGTVPGTGDGSGD